MHASRLLFCLLMATAAVARGADPAPGSVPLAFEFGIASSAQTTAITDLTPFSASRGFGFEDAADASIVDGGAGGHYLTASKPVLFHVVVGEGNYRVTLRAGAVDLPTDLSVKAELRRLMVEHLHVDAGKTAEVSFVVNVRRPVYPGGEVRLKAPRESTDEAWAWDDRLTLEFAAPANAHPNVQAIRIEKVEVPTVYLVGDSTMCDQAKEPWNSWQMFPRFFKDDIAIANHAESGETVASSLAAHRFDKVYSLLKAGDYVFFAFGHNDMKAGAVPLETYIADYHKIVGEVRKRGATPVILSSMERATGITENTLAGYPDAARQVAAEEKVAFIDLHAMSQKLYQAVGKEDLHLLFSFANGKQDLTHTNDFGSYEISKLVLEGVRQNKLELVKHIKEDVPGFDPGHPDRAKEFAVPVSTRWDGTRQAGD